jgi:hypothetical protein
MENPIIARGSHGSVVAAVGRLLYGGTGGYIIEDHHVWVKVNPYTKRDAEAVRQVLAESGLEMDSGNGFRMSSAQTGQP